MREELVAEMKAFISAHGGCNTFRPIAYYDKHMDCIRVQLFDCSFIEERQNKILTVLKSNHDGEGKLAGFNIKGVRHVFLQLGIPFSGVYAITFLLDKIVALYPDKALREAQNHFGPILGAEALEVAM